jgi:hypothetical protein
LGGFGVITHSKDAIHLIKGYALLGAVSFSMATMRYAKLTMLGLGIYAASTFYGSTFYFKTDHLPQLPQLASSKLDVPAKDANDTTVILDEKGNAAIDEARKAGYVQRGAIPAAGKAWCEGDDDKDGIKNATDTDIGGATPNYDVKAAEFNCATGLKWVLAGN